MSSRHFAYLALNFSRTSASVVAVTPILNAAFFGATARNPPQARGVIVGSGVSYMMYIQSRTSRSLLVAVPGDHV